MTHLVTVDQMEALAFDNPGAQIEREYDTRLGEVHRHLTINGIHYIANVVRREVSLAECKRAVQP